MTAKQYLDKVFQIRGRIEDYEMEMERLQTIAEGLKAIRYDKDLVQVSPSNKMEETMVELVDLANRYVQMIVKLHLEIVKRGQMIDELKPGEATVLRWRYLKCNENGNQHSLRDIAKITGYSFDHVKRLHREGLAAFTKRNKKMLEEKDATQCHL